MAKIKLQKKPLSFHYFWAGVLLALASFFVYFFSIDSQARILSCNGNYYLSDREIYETAKVSRKSRVYLVPDFIYKNRLEQLNLIDSVKVKKSQGKLDFTIKEKVIIGYYIKDNKNYMLTIDNESIELEEDQLSLIIHFPLLNGFTEKQRELLAKQYKKHEKDLDRTVIEKIAEMVPYEISFDKNMIKMTMQDGNTVYTSMDSFVMMSKYQAMLTQLKGQSVCLLLDSANSAIEKVNCEDVDVQKRAEKAALEKQQKELEKKQKEEEKKQKEKEEKEKKEAEKAQEETQEETQEQPVEAEEIVEEPAYLEDVGDWQLDENSGLEYSAYWNAYRDPFSGIYYYWNEEGYYFEEIIN